MAQVNHPAKQLAAQIATEWINVNNSESPEERQYYLNTIARLEALQVEANTRAQR